MRIASQVLIYSFTFLLTVSVSATSRGQRQDNSWAVNIPPDIVRLLEMPSRPTMAESVPFLNQLPEFEDVPSVIQVKNAHVYQPEHWVKVMLKHGPTLIAAMEKAFPGATWAFIGRDSQAIADMLEGFYLSIGQQNRVVRLMVSKASFNGVTPQTLVHFVLEHGFSFKDIKHREPYVFVDTVSTGGGQQGRMFLNALYSYYANHLKGKPADLIKKLNMFALFVSTFRSAPVPSSAIKSVSRDLEIQFSLTGDRPHNFGDEFKLTGFSENQDKSNEAGYEHFSGAWTESFGPIVSIDGKLKATPGNITDLRTHENILWMQKEIWNAVNSETFHHQVYEAAKKLGYEFPLKRPSPEASEPSSAATNLTDLIRQDLQHNDDMVKKANAPGFDFSNFTPKARAVNETAMQVAQSNGAGQNGVNFNYLQSTWQHIRARHSSVSKLSAIMPRFLNYLSNAYSSAWATQADVADMVIAALSSDFKITSSFLEAYAKLFRTVPNLKKKIYEIDQKKTLYWTLKKIRLFERVKQNLKGESCAEVINES